ncbi:G5 domain-containing protein [Gemella palaticanis]|uniref:G5 domain-containing protein n=1 Tax=Gemelliphila palaticanis TaxID=81950 RepID=A0ABX2SZS1_9BACL|nr:G5 domain-containing protein [Gemella palaticanis]MBF0715955.1 G5 domain-containing protein [Gemella palaticanis]NYS47885.1 G5 domain-containing protein [Gemella palaticanis]
MNKFKKFIAALSVTAVLSSGAYIANEEYKTVALAIHLDDNVINTKVKKGTVKEILDKQGIIISEYDRVEPGLDSEIKQGDTLKIFKSRDVVIKDGETTLNKKTTYKKVEDILKELNITLGEYDKVTPNLQSEVEFVDTITITRVEKIKETTKEEIKYETVEESNPDLLVGEKKVKTAGENGEKEVVKEVVKENGKVISETVVSEKTITEATKEVVYVGTKVVYNSPSYNTSYNTAPVNYNYVAPAPSGYPVVLANGNTAGETGAYAAKQMEARTGVSASTWEHIIARESNGQVNARNASGASGLFQTMPGWGSTATVDDQINAAVKAYNSQGLSAWGM